jgi:hypothetical protein
MTAVATLRVDPAVAALMLEDAALLTTIAEQLGGVDRDGSS